MDFDALKEQYDRDGYLVMERFFPVDLVSEMQWVTREYVAGVEDGSLAGPLLDTFTGKNGGQQLRRIGRPQDVAPVYDRAMRYEPLVDLLQVLLGGTVRFDHGKLNFKPPSGGAAVEWHQDWAYYPQTNDDMLAVGVMIEDCTLESGPLMVVPGSHKSEVYNHHDSNGSFVGGIHADELTKLLPTAVPVTGPAGSISIHHVRMLHGSTANRSNQNRPLLLFNYVAVDAFPIFRRYDWDEFNQRILRGEPTSSPRVVSLPVRVPDPMPKAKDEYATGSLFEVQQKMEAPLYQETPNQDISAAKPAKSAT